MAESVLDAADDARVATLFARCNTEDLDPNERDRLLGTLARLSREYL
jgi:hypothetical protein